MVTSANAALLNGQWHHLAVSFDGTGTKLYVNGNLVRSNPAQKLAQGYSGYFRIGGLSPNDLNNSLVGSYDDVRIYDRALTADEVGYLASTHAVGTCVATVTSLPSAANAGPDQSVCNGTFTMSAHTPAVGTGMWSVVSGTATIASPASASSGVSGVPPGSSATLRWTVSNGTCGTNADDVVLTNQGALAAANAGLNQANCGNGSFTMSATQPMVGAGVWSVVSGTATIASPASPFEPHEPHGPAARNCPEPPKKPAARNCPE